MYVEASLFYFLLRFLLSAYLTLDVGTDELAVGILHLPLDSPIPSRDRRCLHLEV